MPKPAWRTVVVIVFLALVTLVEMRICLDHGDLGVKLFEAAAWCNVLLGAIAAGKAVTEHLGNGSGLRGVINTLMTSAKPGDPAPGEESRGTP